ncbi:MAG: hypothetical protein KIT84_41335 [Labilithrix sp.]|nr:hypothetical protein [Labilithrix sp.]MCW5817515.1 hypothetical protein [Labilithrix sp.]
MVSRDALLLLAALGLAACAHSDPRRYGLRAPVTRDQDLDDVTLDCKGKDAKNAPCLEEYVSSFAWDAADNTLFRPISEALILKPRGPARNVNAFDEVPDSSWFVNRIGVRAMTEQEVFDGYCKPGKTLNADLPDGSWLIDHGKDNGANPGFRVKSEGVKYMLKLDAIDDKQGERGTAATAIAARLYYAAGWWAPCDAIVWFRRALLALKPGLEIQANVGKAKDFDEKLLQELLDNTSKRGDLYRAAASRWLPGKSLGPFTYDGTRADDPSDVIPHEHRRDLRGARVIAAWLNHFDAREQNSMATWMSAGADENKGHVRHWYIDLGDSFGSEWTVEGFSKSHGHAYVLDFPYLFEDFFTLGIPRRPWDYNTRSPEAPIFGFFSEKDFDPDVWRNEYPNAAFSNLTEGDGAWATRIIARFSPEQIRAAVRAGDFTDPAHSAFLVRVLLARQRTLELRYFQKLSPITDVVVSGDKVCGVDLARRKETWPEAAFRYQASIVRGAADKPLPHPAFAEEDGRVCVDLPSKQPDGGAPDDDASRYVVLRIANGVAKTPLELHLYDRGPKKGHTLVGIERREP